MMNVPLLMSGMGQLATWNVLQAPTKMPRSVSHVLKVVKSVWVCSSAPNAEEPSTSMLAHADRNVPRAHSLWMESVMVACLLAQSALGEVIVVIHA